MAKPLIYSGGAAADAFYAVVAAWAVFEGVTRLVQRWRAGHRTPLSFQDPSSAVVGLSIAASIVAAVELGRHGGVLWPGGRLWPVVAGIVLVAAGTGIRAWAVVSLGRFFQYQIEIQAGHRVVTRGPYRYVRHPSYSGMALVLTGFALGTGDVLSLLVAAVLTGVGLTVRIRAEERQLTDALGAEYTEFAAHHKRLIPGVW